MRRLAGLLGGPVPGWMQRDSEDADPPGRMLDHGQDVGRVPSSRSAVKKSHARIAPAWERRNCGQAGPVRRGAGPVPSALRISRTAGAVGLDSRAGQLAVDPAVSPSGVLPG